MNPDNARPRLIWFSLKFKEESVTSTSEAVTKSFISLDSNYYKNKKRIQNKLNNIKSTFTIKDLENLSGIKAHTIRIWEKRYNLLEPKRTETNIRYYDLASFQKLLNISYLNNNGYKISKIAEISEDELTAKVNQIIEKNQVILNFELSG
mgnify:CR=1 FL=1